MKLADLMLRASLALGLGEPGYCIAASSHVIQFFPHHLRARTLLGQALLDRGYPADAAVHFRHALEYDPENVVARAGLAAALEQEGNVRQAIEQLDRAVDIAPGSRDLREAKSTLSGLLRRDPDAPAGTAAVSLAARAKVLDTRGDHTDAAGLLAKAAAEHPDRPELALARADALWAAGRWEEACQAAAVIAGRFPTVLKAQAIIARHLLHTGDDAAAAAVIHDIRSTDPSDSILGPVLTPAGYRLPPFASLVELPDPGIDPSPAVEQAIAAGVADIPAPEPGHDYPEVESSGSSIKSAVADVARDVGKALVQVAQELVPTPEEAATIQRGGFAIVTIVSNLRRKYGERGAGRIQQRLGALRDILREKGYQAELLLLDQPEAMAALGLGPAHGDDAESIRNAVQGGAEVFRARQVTMDHLLLIGGPDILPYFRLGNPAEDDDEDVASDAPYAIGSRNYFAPGCAIGRMPDGLDGGPGFLLNQIERAIARVRDADLASLSGPRLLKKLNPFTRDPDAIQAFGYAAAVWQGAAEAVFGGMGHADDIRFCPPQSSQTLEGQWLHQRDFLVFNLHGTAHSPSWFGQKDDRYPEDFPLFPIAIGPDLLDDVDLEGAIVFTEACYGAHIVDKPVSDAMALRLLDRGAACVIGSTRIAYGSSEPPLTGADLLASLTWDYLLAGQTAGEALAHARIAYMNQATRRQGYLDGDDQKTLLSFHLLGDPAARLTVNPRRAAAQQATLAAKGLSQPKSLDAPLYCKVRAHSSQAQASLPKGDLLGRALRWLTRAAPDIGEAGAVIVPRATCDDPHVRAGEPCGSCAMAGAGDAAGTYVVTTHKSLSLADGTRIDRIARATVDGQGDLLKISVSK